jgi:decaprenylphospho-beta-D-ribofuranose 2-oxidase
VLRGPTVASIGEGLSSGSVTTAIPRGMGRSYGDAAQLRDGNVIDITAMRAFELDAERGVVTAQAGATLGQLLDPLAATGWTLPVVPGTQHVSIGGAIASDVHGKNHGAVGTFGSHVLELGLLTGSGDVLTLKPGDESGLLAATLGGMGLTGVIVWAAVKLTRLRSASLSVDTDRIESLDDALAVLDSPGGVHRVAWLDLLGDKPVRGVVTRADQLLHEPPANGGPPATTTLAAKLRIPPRWPGRMLKPATVRAFNEFRFRTVPRRQTGHIEPFGTHMFPLDVLEAWPRLYGPAGFVQYQLVLPRGREQALHGLIALLRRSPVPCYLAVLKDFGPANFAPLSFPIAGWTLAMDLPRSAPGLEPLLRRFDELVAGAGGRVYLAKDGRLGPDMVQAMYPRLNEWRELRELADPEHRWCSDLSLRTGLLKP